MKRIYTFQTKHQYKNRKFYTFSANCSISRKVEYPFKGSLVEVIDAVELYNEISHSAVVTLFAEDMTAYNSVKKTIIEASWIEDAEVYHGKNMYALIKGLDIQKNTSKYDTDLEVDDNNSLKNVYINIDQAFTIESTKKLNAIYTEISQNDFSAAQLPEIQIDILEVDYLSYIQPIHCAKTISEMQLSKVVFLESIIKGIQVFNAINTMLSADFIKQNSLSLYVTVADEMKFDGFSHSGTQNTYSVASIAIIKKKLLEDGVELFLNQQRQQEVLTTKKSDISSFENIIAFVSDVSHDENELLLVEKESFSMVAIDEAAHLKRHDLCAKTIRNEKKLRKNEALPVVSLFFEHITPINSKLTAHHHKTERANIKTVRIGQNVYELDSATFTTFKMAGIINNENQKQDSIFGADGLVQLYDHSTVNHFNKAVAMPINHSDKILKDIGAATSFLDGNQEYATEAEKIDLEDIHGFAVVFEGRDFRFDEHKNSLTKRYAQLLQINNSNYAADIVASDKKKESSSGLADWSVEADNVMDGPHTLAANDIENVPLNIDSMRPNFSINGVRRFSDSLLLTGIGAPSIFIYTGSALNEITNDAIMDFSDKLMVEIFFERAILKETDESSSHLGYPIIVITPQNQLSDKNNVIDSKLLLSKEVIKTENEINIALHESDKNKQSAVVAEEVRLNISNSIINQYETEMVKGFNFAESNKIVLTDNIKSNSQDNTESVIEIESIYGDLSSATNEINYTMVSTDGKENFLVRIADSVNLDYLITNNDIAADCMKEERSFVYRIVNTTIDDLSLIEWTSDINTTVSIEDELNSYSAFYALIEHPDNLLTNPAFESVVVKNNAISFKALWETEAVKLTESEWLADLPTYVVDADTSDKIEEIEKKKRIWLIPARANWWSKWFNKKTR